MTDPLNQLADELADRAEQVMPHTAALVIVADTSGKVAYRSRLGYADLNAILRSLAQPLSENEEVPE